MPSYIIVSGSEENMSNHTSSDEYDYSENSELSYFNSNYTLLDAIEFYYNNEFVKYSQLPFQVFIVLSSLGVFFNLLNIVVYSRPSMVSSINMLLLAFEAANVVFFSTFIAQGIEFYFAPKMVYSFSWSIYKKLTPYIRLTSSCVSNWLAVTIGIWRCIAVGLTMRAGEFLSKTRAKLVIAFVVVASPLLTVPTLLLAWAIPEVIPHYDDYGELEVNYTLYFFERDDNYHYIFWVFNVITLIITLIPCLILILATSFLIFSLHRASRARRLLVGSPESVGQIRDRKMTLMLLVVLLTFVISYLPDALCVCILMHHYDDFVTGTKTWATSGICKSLIMGGIYPILSNSITFFIYYLMSENFRETFQNFFMLSHLFHIIRRRISTISQITTASTISAPAIPGKSESKL